MLPTILEVAIGAVLIFLTLSAICSSVAELISEALNLRSRYLQQGIVTLLSDPDRLTQGLAAPVPASDLVAEVLRHPLLQKLGAAPPQNAIIRQIRTLTRTPEINLPPQVPPALFASVLVDELRRRAPNYGTRLTGLRMRLKSLADSINNGMIGAAAPVPPVIFNAIDQRDARQALEEIRQALPLIADERVRVAVTNLVRSWEIEQIRQGVQSLPNSRTRDVLLTFVNETDYKVQEIEHLQQQIADWFDSGMNQVSAWYKEHISTFLRVSAVVICLLFNADVLQIVDTLWRDPTLRQALVIQAEMVSQAPAPGQFASTNPPVDAIKQVAAQLEQASSLPLGWSCDQVNAILHSGYYYRVLGESEQKDPGGACSRVERVVNGQSTVLSVEGGGLSLPNLGYKLTGLGLMSLGVSLGAGFWYKLLKQLLSLRSDKASAP